MGYHKVKIERGKLGEFSKIREEFEEAQDAFDQDNKIMLLLELSDMIGAVDQYCKKHHNISLKDVITMKDATKSAFESGDRK